MSYYLMAYGTITLKIISAFVVVLIFLKVFGMKNQLKQMTSLDLITNFILSAILSGYIINADLSLIGFFIVMMIYIGLVYLVNVLTKRTNWGRRTFIGAPRTIIQNGKIDMAMMASLNLSAHDLASALRKQHIHSIGEVKMAQIEPGGDLTIVKKGDQDYSTIIIDDGIVDPESLVKIKKDETWLTNQLKKKKIKDVSNVFVAQFHKGRLHIVKKD